MMAYQREITPPSCDLVSSVSHIVALEQGYRVPVVTTLHLEDGVRRNTSEGSIDLVSVPMETFP